MTKNFIPISMLVALIGAASLVFSPSTQGSPASGTAGSISKATAARGLTAQAKPRKAKCTATKAPSDYMDSLIHMPAGALEGQLPNGLRYVIMRNDYPEKKAEFRLVWRVGAVQQDDTQGGCAHFLEHMAFGGSTNFPNRGAVAYLESLGMKYGVDINAYTGHDRTIYMFAMPTDSLEELGYGKPLEIIADWMGRLTINPDRVATEKGIILEELRSSFQEDPFYDLKIGQNRFSERMPLGTSEEVSRVTADVLEDFYRKWYLPQFGTVVVVGDVNPEKVEEEIKRKFAFLPKADDPGYRTYPLTYSPAHNIQLSVDTLNNQETAELIIPHPTVVTRTLGDIRTKSVGRVLVDALSYRLSKRGFDAEVTDNWYLSSTNHFVLKARENRNLPLDSCITAIGAEVSDILTHGFGDDEIRYHADRVSRHIANNLHSDFSSAMWCEDFADYALSGDRYLSDPAQLCPVQHMVSSISADEVRETLREWISHSDTMLIAVSTSPANAPRRTIGSVMASWRKGLENPHEQFVFTAPVKKAVDTIPTPEVLQRRLPFNESDIASQRRYPGLGITELTLTNGAKLIMRPTRDDGDVMFAMLGPGGYGTIPVKDLPLYNSTGSYIDMGGIAKMPEQLGEYMYQNGMALGIALENNWHGYLGSFDSDNATEFFNLVYEKITDPELRYDDFNDIKQSMLDDVDGERESVLAKMLDRAPDRKLMARMDRLMCNVLDADAAYADAKDLRQARIDNIQRLDLDSIAAFYRHLYMRPDDCAFIVCGNFDPETMTRAFVPVFSRLPASPERTLRTTKLSLPTETVVERFENENPSQTQFDYVYFGQYEPGLRNSLILKLMANILRNHVIAELREHRALVYSPYVFLNYEGLPRRYFYFDINSSSDNAKMPEVRRALDYVLDHLRNTPVSEAELQAIRRSCLIAKRDALTPYSPSGWRTTLLSLIKNGESLEDFERYEAVISSITPEEIQHSFRSLINPDLYLMLYMSDSEIQH